MLSDIADFVAEVVATIVAVLGLLLAGIIGVGVAFYLAVAPATCYSKGNKMGIEVSWVFWTDCMIMVNGTWLPWSEVVPVLRDGKIVFEPKPVVRLKDAQ